MLDDTSLFTVVYDVDIATDKLNRDLDTIFNWTHKWKMQFNPDKSKQAIQVIFSQRKDAVIRLPVFFNGSEVAVKTEHKHLDMIIDSKLNFQSHIREAIIKARRGIGIIHYLSKHVSRDVVDQIYKLYVRPHLDYGDIIYYTYDPEFKLDFTKKIGIHPILSSTSDGWGMVWKTGFTKSLAGKSFTIQGGINACVTFTNCGIIRDRITYILKYYKNASFTTI